MTTLTSRLPTPITLYPVDVYGVCVHDEPQHTGTRLGHDLPATIGREGQAAHLEVKTAVSASENLQWRRLGV